MPYFDDYLYADASSDSANGCDYRRLLDYCSDNCDGLATAMDSFKGLSGAVGFVREWIMADDDDVHMRWLFG